MQLMKLNYIHAWLRLESFQGFSRAVREEKKSLRFLRNYKFRYFLKPPNARHTKREQKKRKKIKRTPYGAMTSSFLKNILSDNNINGFYIKLIISFFSLTLTTVTCCWWLTFWFSLLSATSAVIIASAREPQIVLCLKRWHYRNMKRSTWRWSKEMSCQVPASRLLFPSSFDKWQLSFGTFSRCLHTRT